MTTLHFWPRAITVAVIALLLGIGAVVYVRTSDAAKITNPTVVVPPANQEPASTYKKPVENKATREARLVADEYLEAVRICDRAKMDTFRVSPISDDAFKTCHAEDMMGFTVSSGDLLDYTNEYNDELKAKLESATFLPKTDPAESAFGHENIVIMVREPAGDNIWKVYN